MQYFILFFKEQFIGVLHYTKDRKIRTGKLTITEPECTNYSNMWYTLNTVLGVLRVQQPKQRLYSLTIFQHVTVIIITKPFSKCPQLYYRFPMSVSLCDHNLYQLSKTIHHNPIQTNHSLKESLGLSPSITGGRLGCCTLNTPKVYCTLCI